MAYTKYSLTPANNTAAPPDGAPEGMLPSAVNDTMRDMMAQIRDCGDGIRGGTYTMTAPIITGGTINGATIGATTASTGKFTTLEATGVATFSAGAVGTPAITTTGDTNTGIFFPAADTIAFTEGGVESMRIDSSGNVGIGTSSPGYALDVRSTTAPAIRLSRSGTAGQIASMVFEDGNATLGSGSTTRVASDAGAMSFSTGGTSGAVTGGTERMRIDSSGNVGIGTSSPVAQNGRVLQIDGGATAADLRLTNTATGSAKDNGVLLGLAGSDAYLYNFENAFMAFGTNATERMRIDSSGNLCFNTTNSLPGVGGTSTGIALNSGNLLAVSRGSDTPVSINRSTNDGNLVDLRQDGTSEGTISVSGSTVSYNGGHLSRWSQLPNGSKDESIVKGTVMSNLDDMCVWTKDGTVLDNEQLNKMKVSDVEGDTNVAGVFVNWTRDEDCNTDDMNVGMTGDMIIRIADGVVVQKGDLLMSAGDGTAKPQGDDIVRSKTVAKVTSNHVTCTYADGSYCVPCVLMAC